MAFAHAGLPLRWEGKAGTLSETGVVAEGELKGRTVLRINPKYFRPAEVSASPLWHCCSPARDIWLTNRQGCIAPYDVHCKDVRSMPAS